MCSTDDYSLHYVLLLCLVLSVDCCLSPPLSIICSFYICIPFPPSFQLLMIVWFLTPTPPLQLHTLSNVFHCLTLRDRAVSIWYESMLWNKRKILNFNWNNTSQLQEESMTSTAAAFSQTYGNSRRLINYLNGVVMTYSPAPVTSTHKKDPAASFIRFTHRTKQCSVASSIMIRGKINTGLIA